MLLSCSTCVVVLLQKVGEAYRLLTVETPKNPTPQKAPAAMPDDTVPPTPTNTAPDEGRSKKKSVAKKNPDEGFFFATDGLLIKALRVIKKLIEKGHIPTTKVPETPDEGRADGFGFRDLRFYQVRRHSETSRILHKPIKMINFLVQPCQYSNNRIHRIRIHHLEFSKHLCSVVF